MDLRQYRRKALSKRKNKRNHNKYPPRKEWNDIFRLLNETFNLKVHYTQQTTYLDRRKAK